MKIVADLHLHSKYSRAVSPEMVLPEMVRWGNKKGIGLLATGDWTHPDWFKELKENLTEASGGLYKIKGQKTEDPLFLLSGEISSIFTQGGKGRRIHTLVFAPSLETVEKINKELAKRKCNLRSDGRPIIGLSCKAIAEIVFSIDPTCLIIPAHVWTPYFGVYGSMSGFDSLNDAFGEFADKIFAVETGLSSDPMMNWRVKELDKRSLMSFSDAHSGPKLGREATVIEFDKKNIGYMDVREAIANGQDGGEKKSAKISHTIEFYPEEGKYHYSGHKACGIKQAPSETRKYGSTCSVCGKKMTLGVMHRVEELAGRSVDDLKIEYGKTGSGTRMIKSGLFPNRAGYIMLVPLQEILAEALETGRSSKQVEGLYQKITGELGGEFGILMDKTLSEISRVGGEKVAEGVSKVRSGDIIIDPGYDGEFGVVKIWGEVKKQVNGRKQMSLF